MSIEITRGSVQEIRSQVEEALHHIEEATGLVATLDSRATYSPGANVVFKLVLAVKTRGGVQTPEAVHFQQLCSSYGLKLSDLGKTFTHQGQQYKITGLTSRRRKFPINAERKDGKMFKLSADLVKKGLGR